MTEGSPDEDRIEDEERGAGDGGNSPPRTPTWVKVFVVVGILLVLLLVVRLVAGGGHGPSRHLPQAEKQVFTTSF